MPKTIVVEWSQQQLRVLECEGRGGRVRIEWLRWLPLPSGEAATPDAGRDALKEALAGTARGARVIGLIGRTQAVLRDLRVPDAPAEELPGIVRFQAMRELSFSIDQAAVDFEAIGPADADGQQRVILAALPQETISLCQSAVAGAGLQLSRLGLRPHATWRAYRAVARDADSPVLVVNVTADALELTVGRNASVLFSRGTVLRGNADDPAAGYKTAPVVAEVRRTIAAFANQTPGVEVTRVAVAGGPGEHAELCDALASSLTIPVERFDPFEAVELTRDLKDASQEWSGQRGAFAAVVGAAISATEPWPIEFLNPKKPVVQRDRRKPLAVLAAAAVAFILGGAYFVSYLHISQGDQNIRTLAALLDKKKEMLKEFGGEMLARDAIEDWRKRETNCLEQLRRLSDEYPDTRHMYTTAMTITTDESGDATPRIVLDSLARTPGQVSEFHTQLNRGGQYSAQQNGAWQTVSGAGEFRYVFKSTLAAKPVSTDAADGDGSVAQRKDRRRAPVPDATPTRREAGAMPTSGTRFGQ